MHHSESPPDTTGYISISDNSTGLEENATRKRTGIRMDSSILTDSSFNEFDMDLSSAVSTTKADTSQNVQNLKKETQKIASGVGHATIEIITGLITAVYILCLLCAAVVRSDYTSLVYMAIFFLTVAFPSHYPYFFQLPVYRLLMWTPRFLFSILSTLYSLIFLITFFSLQIVFKYGDKSFLTPTVEQILKDFGFVW
jgi:uncharacterized membrane protein